MDGQLSRRAALTSGASSLAAVAGCLGIISGNDNGTGTTTGNGSGNGNEDTLKLGVLAPESGGRSKFGSAIRDAIELATGRVNESDTGYSVDLSVKDTENDPETAVEAATSLVDAGYQAFVGPAGDEATIRVTKNVLAQEEVVACSPLASATDVFDVADDDLLFTTAPPADKIGSGIARVGALQGPDSVSVLHEQTPYARTVTGNAESGFEPRGITIKNSVAVESGADSYGSKIESVMSDDPKALFVATEPATGISLLETYFAEYDDVPVYLPDRMRFASLPETLGVSMDDDRVVGLRPRWRRGDSPFPEMFAGAYDRRPSIFAAQAYDATVVLLLAIAAAGTDDYDGAEIAEKVRFVANKQSTIEGVRSPRAKNFPSTLQALAEGARANYKGPTGDVEFSQNAGFLIDITLEALAFKPETEDGFEQTLPISL